MGNPFSEHFPEVVSLNRTCASESTINCLRSIEGTGMEQFREFVRNVLNEKSVSIRRPIKHQFGLEDENEDGGTERRCFCFGQLYVAL